MKKSLALVALLLAIATPTVAEGPARLSEALTAQRELVANSYDDPGALNDLANLLVLGGELEEAETVYQQALYWAPDSGTIHYNLGLLMQQQDLHEQAIAEFTKVVEVHPDNAWAHYQMGLSLEAMNSKGDAAVDSYARAFFLDPRLAFADVNPQVIDSRHLTAAMLQAHRRAPGRVVAPLSYQDPERIAAILLPPPPREDRHSPEIDGGPGGPASPTVAGPTGGENGSDEPGLPVDLTNSQQQRARALARSQRPPTNRVIPAADDPARAAPAEQTGENEMDDLFDDWDTEEDPGAGDDPFDDFAPREESTGRLELRLLPATGDVSSDPDHQASRTETTPESTRGR